MSSNSAANSPKGCIAGTQEGSPKFVLVISAIVSVTAEKCGGLFCHPVGKTKGTAIRYSDDPGRAGKTRLSLAASFGARYHHSHLPWPKERGRRQDWPAMFLPKDPSEGTRPRCIQLVVCSDKRIYRRQKSGSQRRAWARDVCSTALRRSWRCSKSTPRSRCLFAVKINRRLTMATVITERSLWLLVKWVTTSRDKPGANKIGPKSLAKKNHLL